MTREELNQKKQDEIVNEEKREKRKKWVIFGFRCIILIIVAFVGFYLYTTYVSTGRFVVKEMRVTNEKLPSNFNGLKVIQFSDLHYGSTMFIEHVKEVVKEINVRNPDLVVFTGDLIDQDYQLSSKEQEQLIRELQKLKATLGKYAVPGEEDGESFNTIFKQSHFNILNNDSDFIYNNTQTPILLVGLASSLKDDIEIDKAYHYFSEENHNSNIYTIGILHEPDSITNILENYPTDLFLAGHSHNGNIRIPYFGAITKVEGAKKFDQEFYQLDYSQLYISSGLGTNGAGFRLFCRPSINFFRLSQK